MIILIVIVFDPLALVLILAADQTFEWHRPKRKDDWEQVWQPKSEAWPEWNDLPPATEDFDPRPAYEPDDGPLTDAQLDKIQEQIAEEQTKNTTLTRELEAVKTTAETLKKKFMNSFINLLKK